MAVSAITPIWSPDFLLPLKLRRSPSQDSSFLLRPSFFLELSPCTGKQPISQNLKPNSEYIQYIHKHKTQTNKQTRYTTSWLLPGHRLLELRQGAFVLIHQSLFSCCLTPSVPRRSLCCGLGSACPILQCALPCSFLPRHLPSSVHAAQQRSRLTTSSSVASAFICFHALPPDRVGTTTTTAITESPSHIPHTHT